MGRRQVSDPMLLEREEYVEQAYFFRALGERFNRQLATQDLIVSLQEELLATTRLPLALDFLAAELKLTGLLAPAMARLGHYFTPFQTFVIREAERDTGKFDFFIAVKLLECEAQYRAGNPTPQGSFLYQFEALCRNRLGYEQGLDAIAADPIFAPEWSEWITTVRRQVGLVDFAELLYVRSAHYQQTRTRQEGREPTDLKPILFGEKEGRIALAHRRKDPLWLFAALQRHLNYPEVPRPRVSNEPRDLLPNLGRRVERLESRLKLLEEEARGGIDLNPFMKPTDDSPPPTA